MRGEYSPLYRGKYILAKIGKNAKLWRTNYSNYSQKDIADLLSMSSNSISTFERGLNNNAVILYTYMSLGFDPKIEYKFRF